MSLEINYEARLRRLGRGLSRLRLLEEAERLEGSLIEFFAAAWPQIDPAPFASSWHLDAIAEHLEAVSYGEIRQLAINLPPRHAKTLLCGVAWNAWTWAQRPDPAYPLIGPQAKFMYLSYSDQLSMDTATTTRRLIQSPWYQARWGDRVKLRGDQEAKAKFDTTTGGTRISASFGGSVLGRGGDIRVIDDPHKVSEVESEVVRRGVIQTYDETIKSRVTDPRTTAEVIIMHRVHECLLPGVMVRTPGGELAIEAIEEGSIVYGSHGWQKVTGTKSAEYDGDVFGVRLYGHPEVCWTTNSHLYLTKRGWTEAHQLRQSDWICFPINGAGKHPVEWEGVRWRQPPQAPSGSFTGTRRTSIGKEELQGIVTLGVTNTEIARRLGIHRNTVQCYLWLYQIEQMADQNPIFGTGHLLDPDFWRFVGYWLAEGCFMAGRHGAVNGVRLTFGYREERLFQDVKAIISKFGVEVQRVVRPSVIEAQVCCSQIARWLKKWFGSGAHAKRIPEFVFSLPSECRLAMLNGWLTGDGCVRAKEGETSGTSVSRAMINEFQRVALSLGERAAIIKGQKATVTVYNGKLIRGSGRSRELRLRRPLSGKRMVFSEIEGDICWYRVKSITQKTYMGPVYDIQTPSHDFVVGNALVHNSDLTAHVLEDDDDDWVHLMLPAEFEPEWKCKTMLGWEDPRTERGELLWPAKWGEKELAPFKKLPYLWSGQYQQSPTPRGGGIIQRDWWQLWPSESYPQCEYVLASLDTAYTEKQENDASALTVWGLFRDSIGNPKVILLYGWEGRLELHDLVTTVANICSADGKMDSVPHFPVDKLIIEAKASGISVGQEMRRLYGQSGRFGVELIDPSRWGDKTARMYSIQPLFADEIVYAPDRKFAELVIANVTSFPKAAHDDIADSVSQAFKYLRDTGLLLRKEEQARETTEALTHRSREPDLY